MTNAIAAAPRPLTFPVTVYQTKNRFDDYDANDMQRGDLPEFTLKEYFGLKHICEGIDPWTNSTSAYPFGNYAFARPATITKQRSSDEIAKLLFDKLRRHAWPVTFLGYRDMFISLVDHFQYGSGQPFASDFLNQAYYNQIVNDKSENSSLWMIQEIVRKSISGGKLEYPQILVDELRDKLGRTILPKFNRWQDRFNGLALSVHDVFATQITMQSLQIDQHSYTLKVHFRGQDHFGLDDNDMMDWRFRSIPIFRIWFLLQRWEKFAYWPFMTNMDATIEIREKHK